MVSRFVVTTAAATFALHSAICLETASAERTTGVLVCIIPFGIMTLAGVIS